MANDLANDVRNCLASDLASGIATHARSFALASYLATHLALSPASVARPFTGWEAPYKMILVDIRVEKDIRKIHCLSRSVVSDGVFKCAKHLV